MERRYLIRYLIIGPSYFIRPTKLEIVTQGYSHQPGSPRLAPR
jgi:hypothetical protein